MLRSYGSRVPNPPVMVSELIDATSATWNFQRLHEVFMPMDIPAIMGIPLCTRNVEDYWGWHFERSGVFTVKSAYRMLVATNLRREAWLEESAGSSSTNTKEKFRCFCGGCLSTQSRQKVFELTAI